MTKCTHGSLVYDSHRNFCRHCEFIDIFRTPEKERTYIIQDGEGVIYTGTPMLAPDGSPTAWSMQSQTNFSIAKPYLHGEDKWMEASTIFSKGNKIK